MSKITVTTIAGQTSGSDANKVKIESGDTLEVVSNATVGGTLGVTGATTLSSNVAVNGGTGGQVAVNYTTASTTGLKLNDTNSGNLGGFIDFRSGSGAGTQRATIQNANNAGIHVNVGTGGSLSFGTGYTAANALDDYEEGSHTITFTNIAANPTSQSSTYTKIGNVVNYIGTLQFPSTSDSNNVNISLPFVSAGRNGIGTFLSNGANDKILFTAGSGQNFMRVYPDNAFSQNNYSTFSTKTFYFTITYQTTA